MITAWLNMTNIFYCVAAVVLYDIYSNFAITIGIIINYFTVCSLYCTTVAIKNLMYELLILVLWIRL